MGQATVDLPDPLDAPPPSSLSGTDDLLAQLAGDEIDRLLAEADLEQKTPGKPATAAGGAAAPAVDTASPQPTNSARVIAAAGPATFASADAAIAASVPVDDELDALLSKLEEDAPKFISSTPSDDGSPPAAAAPLVDKSLVERVPEVLAQFPAAGSTAETPADAATNAAAAAAMPASASLDMSAAERDALKIVDLADDAAAESDALDDTGSSRLAPVIKVLELLNAPLSFVPDALRDTLGKVAIVTLVNSIAVLVYVLFLRH
jgi:hypothetical protein